MNEQDFIKAAIRGSTGAWFETYGRIWAKDRTQGIVTPKQNYLQRKIQQVVDKFDDLDLPARIISLKPRARGSTTYFTAIGYTVMRRSSTSAVFIGGQSDQTVGLWNMLKTYNANDGFDWKNSGEVNDKGAAWSNGSRAKKETAKDIQAGIGDTYQLLHATEAARWAKFGVANAAGVMSNILKAVPLLPKTYVILESTAEGAEGPFYTRFIDAIDAEDFIAGTVELQPGSFVRVFAPWFEFEDSAMRLTDAQQMAVEHSLDSDPEFLGEKELIRLYGRDDNGVLRLGTAIHNYTAWEQLFWRRFAIHEECERDLNTFERDYPHSWETAFQKSGSLRFNSTGVRLLRDRMGSAPIRQTGVIEKTKDGRFVFRQAEKMEAKFIIYEKPAPGYRYILSVDPMTGATQTGGLDPDRHGVFVLRTGFWDNSGRWRRPAVVARIIQCRWDVGVLEPEIWALARYYGGSSGCKIVIEMNMDRGLTELLKERSADLYQREIFNQREQKTSKAFGFLTTEKTRENLIETMATAIRDWDVPGSGIDVWDKDAIDQCANFVRKDNGRSEASEGWKDDDVLSISLGLTVIDQASAYWPPKDFGLPPDLRPVPGSGPRTPSAYS